MRHFTLLVNSKYHGAKPVGTLDVGDAVILKRDCLVWIYQGVALIATLFRITVHYYQLIVYSMSF